MSIYLFPIPAAPETQDAMYEQLAQVPAGTWGRLRAIRSMYPGRWADKEYMAAMMSDDSLANLDCFDSCGWGHPFPAFFELVRDLGFSEHGETTDPTIVRWLLLTQGLDVDFIQPLISGLAWG